MNASLPRQMKAARALYPATGKRAVTKARNRAVILDAARRVFAERGYGRATIRDVIRATPLASGTFYNYFKSKEELFHAVRDATAGGVRPALRAARHGSETAEAFVFGTFHTFFAYAAANKDKFAAIRRHDGLHLRADTLEILAGFKELREDVEAAIAKGLFPATDADFFAAAMLGVAFELAEAMGKRERPDPDAAARFATGLFLNSIAGAHKQG